MDQNHIAPKSFTLGYFEAESGNVGDDLNFWLLPKLLKKEQIEKASENVLIGIGSILDTRFDGYKHKVVAGSGARGTENLPRLDESWDVNFVRGPLTAKALSSQRDVRYITDPAMLIGEYFKEKNKNSDIGLVPYYGANLAFWKSVATSCGYRFISPKLSVDEFVFEIKQCKFVFTEAMHGAIFADSLRVPWQAIESITNQLEGDTHLFKWNDWCSSMNMDFGELSLPVVWPDAKVDGLKSKLKVAYIKNQLKRASKNNFILSDDAVFKDKIISLKDAFSSI